MIKQGSFLGLCPLSQGRPCILIEPEIGHNDNFVEHEGTDNKEDKTDQLEHMELLSLAMDCNDHEEDPNEESSRCINSGALSRRCVLGDSDSEAIEESHGEADCNTQQNEDIVRPEILKGSCRIFEDSIRTEILIAARDLLEDGKKDAPQDAAPETLKSNDFQGI